MMIQTSSIQAATCAYEQADQAFRQDARWLGSDAALSIPLSEQRVLWLFGDTFFSPDGKASRSLGSMVRNTIGLQNGNDLTRDALVFHAGSTASFRPDAFFPSPDPRWYWPGHGIRLAEGPLIIFLYAFLPDAKAALGFAHDGHALAVIDNPDEHPDAWQIAIHACAPPPFDAVPATAVIRDGPHVIGLAIRQHGTHAGALVRYKVQDLLEGNTSRREWWTGPDHGWKSEEDLGTKGPDFVIDDAGAECSIHWDQSRQLFFHVATYGYGASSIGLRTAPALTGPWSPPATIYRPPESDEPGAFVYAAKAHPEIRGKHEGDLVITYATNRFDFREVITPEGMARIYWPKVISIRMDL